MKGVIEFEILRIMGMEFKQFEKDPKVQKEFKNHCEKIIDALGQHFEKYKMEIKVKYKIEK